MRGQDELARNAAHLGKKLALQGRMQVSRRLVEDRDEASRFRKRGAEQQPLPEPGSSEIHRQVMTVMVDGCRYLQGRRRLAALAWHRIGERDVDRCVWSSLMPASAANSRVSSAHWETGIQRHRSALAAWRQQIGQRERLLWHALFVEVEPLGDGVAREIHPPGIARAQHGPA